MTDEQFQQTKLILGQMLYSIWQVANGLPPDEILKFSEGLLLLNDALIKYANEMIKEQSH